jgi:hypothetical protein
MDRLGSRALEIEIVEDGQKALGEEVKFSS